MKPNRKKKLSRGATKLEKARASLPMTGALLSDLASAFRLAPMLRGEKARKGPLAAGTAKKILNDEPTTNPEAVGALARALVDGLFTNDYLRTRGLSETAANEHNTRVASALLAVLARWDRVATMVNVMGEASPSILHVLAMQHGVPSDIAIRAAAFHALYGRLHPALSSAPSWVRKPGLKDWWHSIEQRTEHSKKLSDLRRATGVERDTLRNVQAGKTVPRDDVITKVAHGLARVGVRERATSRKLEPSELEFELRVASAVADAWVRLQRTSLYETIQVHLLDVLRLRKMLVGHAGNILADLLENGLDSAHWPAFEEQLRAAHAGDVVMASIRMKQWTDELHALAEDDPALAAEKIAASFGGSARHLREISEESGEGESDPFADFLEFVGDRLRAIAGAGPRVPAREGLVDELKSEALRHQAHSPWIQHSPAEKEDLLRQSVAAAPRSAKAHAWLGEHLAATGRADEALAEYDEAIRLDPSYAPARRLLAEMMLGLGRNAEALEALDGLPPDAKGAVDAGAMRAWCLFLLGRLDEAAAVAQDVLRQNRHQVLALRVLARCKDAVGETAEARALVKRADHFENPRRPSAPFKPARDTDPKTWRH